MRDKWPRVYTKLQSSVVSEEVLQKSLLLPLTCYPLIPSGRAHLSRARFRKALWRSQFRSRPPAVVENGGEPLPLPCKARRFPSSADAAPGLSDLALASNGTRSLFAKAAEAEQKTNIPLPAGRESRAGAGVHIWVWERRSGELAVGGLGAGLGSSGAGPGSWLGVRKAAIAAVYSNPGGKKPRRWSVEQLEKATGEAAAGRAVSSWRGRQKSVPPRAQLRTSCPQGSGSSPGPGRRRRLFPFAPRAISPLLG